jgi:hypothetical protein
MLPKAILRKWTWIYLFRIVICGGLFKLAAKLCSMAIGIKYYLTLLIAKCEASMYHLMFSSSQEKGFLILWRLANLNMTWVKVFTYAVEQAFHQSTAKLDFFHFSG